MTINEIIGRALLTLPNLFSDDPAQSERAVGRENHGAVALQPRRHSMDWISEGEVAITIDGTWPFSEIGAAVVNALAEEGYVIKRADAPHLPTPD